MARAQRLGQRPDDDGTGQQDCPVVGQCGRVGMFA
jgi:hypothetical protein